MRRGFLGVATLAVVALLFTLVGAAGGSTFYSATNGQWGAYPGQSTTFGAAVQQPINADGSSNFKANGKAVIPVKFALSQGTGAFVFESIYSDNTSPNDEGGTCGTGSGADHANDCAFLSFTPNTPVTFNQITELSSVYSFTLGNCHGGSLRWSVRTSPTQSVFIYYGEHPSFTDCNTNNQSGVNMLSLTDLRFDTSQVGGTFYDDYAGAQALVGSLPILRASLVLDSGWGGNQRLTLTSATFKTAAFSDTFTPAPASPMTSTCPTLQASIRISKVDGAPSGDVNEPLTIQPQDNNGIFRIVDCKYMYNLATSSLSGVGTYTVYATIGSTEFTVATFDLK
jgi:hypothetical protein